MDSRTIGGGGWALPRWKRRDHIFLIPVVKDDKKTPSWLESSLEVKRGVMSKLFAGIHVGWEMRMHMGWSWDIPNTDSESGQSKWLAKGNPEEMPQYKWFKLPRISLSESTCVSIHKYCTLFPPNKPLFNYFLPLWAFFSAKQCQGLVTDHWSSG